MKEKVIYVDFSSKKKRRKKNQHVTVKTNILTKLKSFKYKLLRILKNITNLKHSNEHPTHPYSKNNF
ncbi:hypothetical protein [Clostridium frigidicarnis]|uniref:hypothetical protein n=1 Tax=Clostridium frigidicarnis TaxID=84698 RepID=UPI000B7EE892|nr:hypothetical protein [Clostridium frigidicarnis]